MSKRKLSMGSSDYSDNEDLTGETGYSKDRKRKRGEIEKKRRDKINEYLNEIKELVPTALEKSTVNKLEKAEILQKPDIIQTSEISQRSEISHTSDISQESDISQNSEI